MCTEVCFEYSTLVSYVTSGYSKSVMCVCVKDSIYSPIKTFSILHHLHFLLSTGTSESRRHFKKAMKKGFVISEITKVCLCVNMCVYACV